MITLKDKRKVTEATYKLLLQISFTGGYYTDISYDNYDDQYFVWIKRRVSSLKHIPEGLEVAERFYNSGDNVECVILKGKLTVDEYNLIELFGDDE